MADITSSDISIQTTFNLTPSPKKFNLTDNTAYSTFNDAPAGTPPIALTNVRGMFSIQDPLGALVYKNTGYDADDFTAPDIDADVSLDFNTVDLPLTSDGDVIKGSYIISYKVDVSTYSSPFEKSFTYDYQYEEPCVNIDLSYNCKTSTLTMVDNTPYGDYFSETANPNKWEVTAPAGSGLTPANGTGKSYSVTPIATKQWQVNMTTLAVYTYPDGLIVSDTIKGYDSVEVVCDDGECEIYECLKALEKEYANALCNNPTVAEKKRDTLLNAQMYFNLYRSALNCGKTQDALEYRQKVLSDCSTCDAFCDDSMPVVIVAS